MTSHHKTEFHGVDADCTVTIFSRQIKSFSGDYVKTVRIMHAGDVEVDVTQITADYHSTTMMCYITLTVGEKLQGLMRQHWDTMISKKSLMEMMQENTTSWELNQDSNNAKHSSPRKNFTKNTATWEAYPTAISANEHKGQ